jgi:hypothetical protein
VLKKKRGSAMFGKIFFIVILALEFSAKAMDVGAVTIKQPTKKLLIDLSELLCRGIYNGEAQQVEAVLKQGLNPNLPLYGIERYTNPLPPTQARFSSDEALNFLAYFVGGIGQILPLSLAVWRKQPAIIRLLIAYNAHVNQEASAQKRVVEGYTCSLDRSWVKPLDIAIAVGKAELVKILVEQGARTSSLTYPRAAKQLWGMDLIRYICEHSSENPFQPVNAHFFQYSLSLFVPLFFDAGVHLCFGSKKSLELGKYQSNNYLTCGSIAVPVPANFTGKEPTYLHYVAKCCSVEMTRLLLTYPFFVPLFIDRAQSRQRVLAALMLLTSLRVNRYQIPKEVMHKILSAERTLAFDVLSVLIGPLGSEQPKVQKNEGFFSRLLRPENGIQGSNQIRTCTKAELKQLKKIILNQNVLPKQVVIAVLRDNFIEQQRMLFLLDPHKEDYTHLRNIDILGEGFLREFGDDIEQAIAKKLYEDSEPCSATDGKFLLDRELPLIISGDHVIASQTNVIGTIGDMMIVFFRNADLGNW